MPLFMLQVKITKESCEAFLANPQDRSSAMSQVFEAHGGKLHHYYFALGESDVVVIAELPDTNAAMAVALTVGATGSVSDYKTTPLVTAEDAVTIMKAAAEKAQAYRPPASA